MTGRKGGGTHVLAGLAPSRPAKPARIIAISCINDMYIFSTTIMMFANFIIWQFSPNSFVWRIIILWPFAIPLATKREKNVL